MTPRSSLKKHEVNVIVLIMLITKLKVYQNFIVEVMRP